MAEISFDTIAVLTSGGDAPGMNAAIRAVVRSAIARGLKVKGIIRGYAGLLNEEIIDLDAMSVSGIIHNGGTMLLSARCKEFVQPEYQEKAAEICRKHGIGGIVVLGGDGSFRGAQKLSHLGINTIGVPCTIDMDIPSTDYTIGYDTACNTVMEAIDKINDTSTSHDRCTVVEVMGRDAGYIGMLTAITGAATEVILPENYDHDESRIFAHLLDNMAKGKMHYVIVNSEGIGDSVAMAKRIEAATGIETRASILGHIQRGGSPTVRDRFMGTMMGVKAVDLLLEGKTDRVVGYRAGDFVDYDVDEAAAMQKTVNPEWIRTFNLVRFN